MHLHRSDAPIRWWRTTNVLSTYIENFTYQPSIFVSIPIPISKLPKMAEYDRKAHCRKIEEEKTEWNVPFHCSLRRLIYLLSCGFERRTHEASWEIWADKLVFRFHLDAIGSSSSSRNDGKRQHLFSKENCLTAAFNFYLLCAPFFAEMEIHIKIIAYWKSVKEFSIWSYYSYVPSVAAGHVWIAFTCITST